ncbi:hypothetical protein V6U89_26180 [Micromonospora sp. CPCC 206171]
MAELPAVQVTPSAQAGAEQVTRAVPGGELGGGEQRDAAERGGQPNV